MKQNFLLAKSMVKSIPGFSQLRKSPPPVIVFSSLRLCPYGSVKRGGGGGEGSIKILLFFLFCEEVTIRILSARRKKKDFVFLSPPFCWDKSSFFGKMQKAFSHTQKGIRGKNDFFNCPPALAPLPACNFPRKSLFPLPVNKKEKIAPVGFFPFFVYCRHVPFPRFVRRYFLLFFRENGLPGMGEGEENGGSIQNLVWLSGKSLQDNMSKTLLSHINMIHLMHTYNTHFLHWWQIKLPLTFPMSTCTWCAKF